MKNHKTDGKARRLAGLAAYRSSEDAVSFFSTVFFALYNGVLGLSLASPWHGSICVYYLLLSTLRGLFLALECKRPQMSESRQHRAFFLTSAVLFLMNLALVAPVSLLVLDRRPVHPSLIPAIASAAYTTYKITVAAVKLKRAKGSIFSRGLSLLRFVDALISILVLQNTLITAVNGEITQDMLCLVSVSSAGIFLFGLLLSVLWFRSIKKNHLPKIPP